jgi:hypothetical protein
MIVQLFSKKWWMRSHGMLSNETIILEHIQESHLHI